MSLLHDNPNRRAVHRYAYYDGDTLIFIAKDDLASYDFDDALWTADGEHITLYVPKPVLLEMPSPLQLVPYDELR